jgi:hypothetical protein
MGRMQRNKGKRGEIKHRDVLRSLGFTNAERGQQRHGGPDSPDVRNGISGTHPEVKYYEKHAAIKHLEQAEDEKPDGAVPYAVLRQNGMGLMDEVWLIRAKDIETFIDLYTKGKDE